MATKVIMPKQGLQMTEGTILKWLVGEGGECREGQPLFEMETDKLNITIDAPASGTLLKIIRGEGETVPITELIAVIGTKGEDISSFLHETEAASAVSAPAGDTAPEPKAETKKAERAPGDRIFITPRAKTLAQEKGVAYAELSGSGPDGLIIEKDILNALKDTPRATPLAKKIASEIGTSLAAVQGTGERGKITKADVERAILGTPKTAQERKGVLKPFAGMRKVIAERMLQSKNTNAQTTHTVRVDMSEAMRLRESLKNADKKVSYNDIIAYAVCRALMEYPAMNSELTPEGILEKDYVNLGIAVAVEKGLIVPVIRDADLKTLTGIAEASRELTQKAKEGKLKPEEYRGGSFTISNLGMFGLDEFVAIINPPEAGILAVGKIEKAAVVADDALAIRPMMSLTLSYDHRVVDGAPAAQFLVRVKELLENPYLML